MRLSTTIRGVTGDAQGNDGWAVYRAAQAKKADGVAVIDLTIGEHDVGTDPAILQAMHASAMGGNTGYAPGEGFQDLRCAIAARVAARTGVATTCDNVLVTAGGQAALFAAHVALCDPGDTALICDPYYATYPGVVRAAGAVPRVVACRPEDGFTPTENVLDEAAPAARSLLINSPNNPTGAVYGRATLEGVARVCHRHDLGLVSDEVYETLVWEGRHVSPRALPGMAERTLVVGSLSKSHAMTGSRLGWIVGPAEAIARLKDLATHITFGVPGFIQEAGLFALRLGDAAEAAVAAPFARRSKAVADVLRDYPAICTPSPQGAMFAMLDIRATGVSGTAFANELLRRHAIAVMPGESFGSAAAGHVRIALTVDDAQLVEAVRTIAGHAALLAGEGAWRETAGTTQAADASGGGVFPTG